MNDRKSNTTRIPIPYSRVYLSQHSLNPKISPIHWIFKIKSLKIFDRKVSNLSRNSLESHHTLWLILKIWGYGKISWMFSGLDLLSIIVSQKLFYKIPGQLPLINFDALEILTNANYSTESLEKLFNHRVTYSYYKIFQVLGSTPSAIPPDI